MRKFNPSKIKEVLPFLLDRTDILSTQSERKTSAKDLRCQIARYFKDKIQNCADKGLHLTKDEVALLMVSQNDSAEYAIFRKFPINNIGEVIWLTQLVVHSSYRHQGIAKTLI